MPILQLLSNPQFLFTWLVALVLAITIHEFAHAYVADKLGDPTPRLMGRVTLNPLAHLDPLGTVALLLVGFGWGKPVVFDPFNLQNPKRDTMLISLAGPTSNMLLIILFLILTKMGAISLDIGFVFIWLNLILALFNLLPIHPLDGFKIVAGLLPKDKAIVWDSTAKYGIFVLMLLVLPITPQGSIVSLILNPIITTIMSLLM